MEGSREEDEEEDEEDEEDEEEGGWICGVEGGEGRVDWSSVEVQNKPIFGGFESRKFCE